MLWPNGTKTKPYVTSAFGPRNIPVANASRNHKGTDMVGFRTVRAVADGVVKVAGTPGGWTGGGNQVWVQHDGFFSKSLHLASRSVRVGDRVSAGDDLGEMGETGTASDVHLHLEITPGSLHYWNTGQVDPVKFISSRTASAAGGANESEEDDMSAEAEKQIKAIHDAIFRGGESMKDQGASISDSLSRIARNAAAAADATKPILRSGGKQTSIRQELADTRGAVARLEASQAGLEAALSALAGAKGLDAGAILRAAQTGVENALRKVTFSADVDG